MAAKKSQPTAAKKRTATTKQTDPTPAAQFLVVVFTILSLAFLVETYWHYL